MLNAKKDCAGYDPQRNECKCLRELYCKIEDCKFYKTKDQVEQETIDGIKRRHRIGLPVTDAERNIAHID